MEPTIVVRCVVAAVAAFFSLLLAVPVVIIGLPFLAVSWLTRRLALFLEPHYKCWGDLIEFEAGIGWQPKGNLKTYHLVDDVYRISTDEQGWRGKTTVAESQIVAFGDSFAWGYGIDDKHFFSDLLPELRIKPIGTLGYNMVQELLWMRRLAPQLRGKLVIWFIYFGNDLYENLVPDMCGYRMPFLRSVNGTGAWTVVTSHVNPQRWPTSSTDSELRRRGRDYYGKLADLCSKSFLSDRAYPACEYLLREGQGLCRRAGAELLVMTIPDATQLTERGIRNLLRHGGDPRSFDPDFPDRQIGNICERLGIHLVCLKDYLKANDYKVGDCHWNAKGHRKVAEVMLRVLLGSRYELEFEGVEDSSKAIGNGADALV